MNYKPFIKLGNKSFNLQMISYLNLNDEDRTVTLNINLEKSYHKHKFDTDETYQRFKSYIRLFSTDFGEGEVQEIEQDKSLLTD